MQPLSTIHSAGVQEQTNVLNDRCQTTPHHTRPSDPICAYLYKLKPKPVYCDFSTLVVAAAQEEHVLRSYLAVITAGRGIHNSALS